MKKKLIILLILLACSHTVYAKKYYGKRKTKKPSSGGSLSRETKNRKPGVKVDDKKSDENEKPSHFMIVGINGGTGFTYPTGDITGDGDQKVKVDRGYFFGMDYTFLLNDRGGPMASISYTKKRNSIERSYFTSKMKNTITANFINMGIGYRFLLNFVYINPGLYYGKKTGTWTEKVELNGEEENNIDPTFCNDEYGLFFHTGVSINIYKSLYIDIGIKYEMAFTYFYENGDRLRSNMAGILFGLSCRI
jgi:hypothetical protein